MVTSWLIVFLLQFGTGKSGVRINAARRKDFHPSCCAEKGAAPKFPMKGCQRVARSEVYDFVQGVRCNNNLLWCLRLLVSVWSAKATSLR